MNPFVKPAPENKNPDRDAWKPADKADEAAFDNPTEFPASAAGATEDSRGPIPSGRRRTHGEAG